MRIHHVTLPAQNPQHVAAVLAELLGARSLPLPHLGAFIVYAGDSDGSAIEVWPAAMRSRAGDHEPAPSELPLPEAWPHHAYVTSDTADSKAILAVFAREGWKAERVQNGQPHTGFGLVRGWIENQTTIELGGSEMRGEYERFFQLMAARTSA